MKLKDIILSEVSQMKKDKYCMSSLICGILKKKKKVNWTHRNREEQWLPGAEGVQEMDIRLWKGTNFHL